MTTPDANFTAARTDAAQTFSGVQTFSSNLLGTKIQVGTPATINDATGVAQTLQLANYSAGAYVTGSADNYIYKVSGTIGSVAAHSTIFQTRSDVGAGGFAWVGGASPTPWMILDANQNLNLVTGNLVIGTSGKGIDFSATAGTGTSELLNDYEEGTWTPANGGMTVTSGSWAATGTYTKVGNIVHFTITQTSGTVTAAVGTSAITGFPFTPSVRGAITFTNGAADLVGIGLVDLNATLYNSATITSQTALRFSGWYQV
jgi:hypothetical protein